MAHYCRPREPCRSPRCDRHAKHLVSMPSPGATFHSFMTASALPEAGVLTSGEKATQWTVPVRRNRRRATCIPLPDGYGVNIRDNRSLHEGPAKCPLPFSDTLHVILT